MLFFLQQRMSTTETSFKKCACRNWEGFQPRSQMAHEEVSCYFPGPATGTRLHLTGKETGGGRALGWMQAAASGRAGLRGHPAGTCPTQVSPASPCPLHSPQALGHSWKGLTVGRCHWAALRGSIGAHGGAAAALSWRGDALSAALTPGTSITPLPGTVPPAPALGR